MRYLEVPYPDKDKAKQQGARWDPLKKKWYIPDPDKVDMRLFQAWLPQEQPEDNTLLTDPSAMSQADLLTPDSAERPSLSLTQLLNQVQTKLQQAFPQAVWLRAEIANLNERRGHIYLELSENNEQGQTLASCRAMIWASQAEGLLKRFEQTTGSALQEGQKILVQVQLNFHEKFGFSLLVQDIDPKFTLGEIEANLIAIRQKLIKAGLYQANKQFTLAADLFRIAVISPPNAAGLGDFRAEADALEHHQLCEFVYIHSAFQGEQVLDEMMAAFDVFKALHDKQAFDALVIIRGGGAKLDLNPLNQYELAEAIALAPLPVFTGIGHERDNTILDEVAHSRFDTPSKVIAGIWHRIAQSAQQAMQHWRQIESQSQHQLQKYQAGLLQIKQKIDHNQERSLLFWRNKTDPLFAQIQAKSQQRISQERAGLDYYLETIYTQAQQPIRRFSLKINELHGQVEQSSKRAVVVYRQQIKQTLSFILSSGPQSQLSRGFAMAQTQDGKPITSAKQALKASTFNLEFQDGRLAVKATKPTDSGA